MADIKLVGENDGTIYTSAGGEYLILYKVQAVASGTVTSLRAKMSGNNSYGVMLALYSNSSGEPGSLLTSCASTAVVAGWNTISVSPVDVVSGTYYWLGFNSANPGKVGMISGGASLRRYKEAPYSGFSFPNPPTSLSTEDGKIFMAAWGTIPSGASVGLIGYGLCGNSPLISKVL